MILSGSTLSGAGEGQRSPRANPLRRIWKIFSPFTHLVDERDSELLILY